MPINTGNFAKFMYPGLYGHYGDKYSEKPKQGDQIFETRMSTRAYEEIMGVTGFGLPSIKTEGNAIVYDEEQQGFLTRFTPVVWGHGFIITEETIEDDLYNVVGPQRTEGLAYSMRQGEEIVCANILNRAFNTTYVGGDGATLIASTGAGSASHPNVTGGTWVNGPTQDIDLSEAALEQAKIDIDDFRDDRGKRMQANIKQLIIASSNQFEVERILGTKLRPGTADNDTNAMYAMGTIPQIVVNNYLTDADAWFVQTDVPHGLIKFERRAMKFDVDNSFDDGNAKFKVTHRYSTGWVDPRCLYGSEGT